MKNMKIYIHTFLYNFIRYFKKERKIPVLWNLKIKPISGLSNEKYNIYTF